MNIQRVLLRVMLASLAVAAAVGTLAALTNQTETFWRIIGTCAITAVATGLLIPISHCLKGGTRAAALTAIIAIVVEFILNLALIWNGLGISSPHSDDLAITAGLVFATGLAAVFLVYMLGIGATRRAAICGLILDAAVFFLAMIATWSNAAFGDNFGETAGVLAIFGPMAVACLIGSASGHQRWRRWIGVAAATAAVAMNVYAIWHNLPHDNEVSTVIDTVPAWFAFANLVMLANLKGSQIGVRYLAMIAATVTAVCIDLEFYVNNGERRYGNDDPFTRIASAGGIVTGCAALAVAILAMLNRKSKPEPVATGAIHDITVICPLCQKKQTLPLDTTGQCACGLKMLVQIEEPVCTECGYLLIGLTSDRCPECGTVITPGTQPQAG